MSQVSSDFDEPLLDESDLGGFDDVGFSDDLGSDDLGGADGWDDMDAGAFEAPQTVAAPVRKQGFSIYTVMLIMSFVFLTTAAIMIFIELGRLKG